MIWMGAIFISPLMMVRLFRDERESVRLRLQQNYYHALTPVAWVSLGILGITGIFRAGHHLENGIADLINTSWGQLLIAKFMIVVLMIGAGLYRTYRILPALKSHQNPTTLKRLSTSMQRITAGSALLGFVLLWIITLL